jgi:hypothetical protein
MLHEVLFALLGYTGSIFRQDERAFANSKYFLALKIYLVGSDGKNDFDLD